MSHKLSNDNKTRPSVSADQSSATYTSSQTPPIPLNNSPSIALSATQDTDIEDDADAYIDHEYNKHSRSSSNDSNSSSSSSNKDEQQPQPQIYSNQILKRAPNPLPQQPITNDDDDDDDYIDNNDNDVDDKMFDRILVTFARQESTSRDKRRSLSSSFKLAKKSSTIYGLYGSNQLETNTLPKLCQNEQLLRGRKRQVTTQLIEPCAEKSISKSYFNTLRNCNEINANILLPTHREIWETDHDVSDINAEITPSPMPSPKPSPSPKPQIMKYNSVSTIIDNKMMDSNDISLVGMPTEMNFSVKSVPNVLETVLDLNSIESIQNNRGPRISIRPRGSSTMFITNYSVEDNNNDDDDIKQDESEDSDDANIIDINNNNNIKSTNESNYQSELVFQSTAQSLMISCGNSKEVFAILRKICINLKKDEYMPYIISFSDAILAYEHVESFLKLLGFNKNQQLKQYICYKQNRVSNRLIDCGVLECHKCLLLIQSQLSIINRKDMLHKLPSIMDMQISQSCDSDSMINNTNSLSNDYIQLYELIWSITHDNNDDHNAKVVLLLCYPLVTNAKRIFQCCETRFFNNDNETTINANKNIILSSFNIRAKVIEFIRHWMQRYWKKDWHKNNKLLKYCKSFSKRIKKIYESDVNINQYYEPIEIKKGLHLIKMLDTTIINQKRRLKLTKNKDNFNINEKNKGNKSPKRRKHRKKSSIFEMIGGNSSNKLKLPKNLMDISHIIIAEQITITQFYQFKLIHPRECLNQAWKKNDKKHILAPNITKYINSFNKLTKWIQTSILVAENVKTRGRIIKKWVKVEQELYKLRNFQALCAVHSALSSNEIYKLKDAWNLLAKKHIVAYNMIKVIMKCTGNWKNLRRLQLETHPPMLPYFGMFAQDLIAIEETTNNRSNDGSINWNSLWRVNTAINKYLIYQNTPYHNLCEDANIQTWIQNELNMSDKLDNEWMYQVSKHVSKKDKRESSKHKSTRSLWNNKSINK